MPRIWARGNGVADQNDKNLGMGREIPRRDFLQGAAIGAAVAFGGAFAPQQNGAPQDQQGYYPPTKMGMRGSHPGSFEAAHALRDGDFWNSAKGLIETHEDYDLVVVGGGISGLSAAHFYRAANPKARILILENHDDFGGHAKRNEFHLNDRMELMHGGTFEIQSPRPYSAVAQGLLKELGVDAVALSKTCDDPSIYESHGLTRAIFFDKENFGIDKLVRADFEDERFKPGALKRFLAQTPFSAKVRADIARIEEGREDYWTHLSSDEKKERLSRMSYQDYLLKVVKADPSLIALYRHRTDDWWGCGIDAISALDCWGVSFPGFDGLKLAPGPITRMGYTPAGFAATGGSPTFHFPDGNASIARLLVRSLIPQAMPGRDAVDIVTAKADYSRLDRAGAAVRIRLGSLVVRARNVKRGVEIAYTRSSGGGAVKRVRARHCVLASWNMMIPYLCPEMPQPQKDALHSLVKTPLVYASVALRNWTSFVKLGIRAVYAPGSYFSSFELNQPVNIGGYKSVRAPEEPILIHMLRTPAQPGLSEDDQNKAGRAELLATRFETFEHHMRDQLHRTLRAGGFDAARDIEGIAVNRWPHGYSPEYNPLYDGDAPPRKNLIARARFGNIAIANADSGMAAYTDSAIDQAHRAVKELVG